MKSVLIPFAAVIVLTATGSVFAGASVEPEAKPSVTVTPIVVPVEVTAEPVICAPTAQKVCESQEVTVEAKDPATPEVKVELTPEQPAEVLVTDKPTQS